MISKLYKLIALLIFFTGVALFVIYRSGGFDASSQKSPVKQPLTKKKDTEDTKMQLFRIVESNEDQNIELEVPIESLVQQPDESMQDTSEETPDNFDRFSTSKSGVLIRQDPPVLGGEYFSTSKSGIFISQKLSGEEEKDSSDTESQNPPNNE